MVREKDRGLEGRGWWRDRSSCTASGKSGEKETRGERFRNVGGENGGVTNRRIMGGKEPLLEKDMCEREDKQIGLVEEHM